MLRILFISLIVLKTITVYSQDTTSAFGVQISYNLYNFKVAKTPLYTGDAKNGLSYGLRFENSLTRNLFLLTGISYAPVKVQFDFTSSNLINLPSAARKSQLKLHYINVPVLLKYTMIDMGFYKLSPAAGVLNNLILMHKEETIYSDNTLRESSFFTNNLNIYTPSVMLSAINEFYFNEKYFISLEPNFRYDLSTFNDELISTPRTVFGVAMAVSYRY